MRKALQFFLVALLFPLAAHADPLDDAKLQGLVGEDASGYVAAVADQPDQGTRALVNDVNEQRRALYEGIAAENGIAVEDVEQLAGAKAIANTAPGHYVRLAGDGWRQK